ncbi:MAG: hypothetical protein Q7J13_13225 [Brevundimonas sp.]|jgi:hypothetical protein|uniref:hypothetical protein n=1 Tax=Brevundimonas sp. TaxID=1871086 RepID=UPI00272641AD|nr:hypothetical protein [Brevundimonas sp.]MDO9588881.1 hypothetical protein [Brevundimonas sp.]
MFGKFQRRNSRKARLSSWFAHERDGDMQAFDLQPLAAKIGAWLAAIRSARARRRSARAAEKGRPVIPD